MFFIYSFLNTTCQRSTMAKTHLIRDRSGADNQDTPKDPGETQ